MRQASAYELRPICVDRETCVVDVADEMDARSVGSVVVVDSESRPVGILTDRDLTLRVVAAGRDPAKTSAGDVMSTDLLTASRRDSAIEVLKKLEARGVRRAPLVEDGHVVGLVSLDDLVAELGTQLWNLSETIRVELRESRRETPIRRRREARSYLLEDLGSQLGELGEEVRDRIDRAGRDIADRLGLRRP
ncbi:MAG: CBS domain-containing protein [Deltaproteobacteria bacterium]|nr:CBS domain-containing protein [Deltaproteobacteria bacterium]MBW2445672.1 CBS domain-containing protein [Deltaproteobacteria bacterium]